MRGGRRPVILTPMATNENDAILVRMRGMPSQTGTKLEAMMDPANPYTVGYYNTRIGSVFRGLDLRSGLKAGDPAREGSTIFNGVWGIDVRNADGLIVVGDLKSGLWVFKMDGFDGWNGHQWGMPNISSAQDWDNGPEGAPKPTKVS